LLKTGGISRDIDQVIWHGHLKRLVLFNEAVGQLLHGRRDGGAQISHFKFQFKMPSANFRGVQQIV